MKITGIILTGGKSRRMGTDKALIDFEGQTLLARAVDFCTMFCDEVLISSDSQAHKIDGIRTIADEFKDCGPMGGIYSCLRESTNFWNFVLSVDAPYVEQEFVQTLIKETNDFDAVIPLHQGKKEPLIALYNKNILPEIKRQLKAESYKVHSFIANINTGIFDARLWLEKYPKLFYNLNYPEDLKSIDNS